MSAGHRDPAALERAASQLDEIARKLVQLAQSTQDYQRLVTPIAQSVDQLVGGSATGKDKQIAALLKGVARDVSRSASASHQAAQAAKKLTAHARAEATEIRRRQQDAERQANKSGTGR